MYKFKRILTINRPIHGEELLCERIKKWLIKKSVIISAILSILVFLTLLSLVLYNLSHQHLTQKTLIATTDCQAVLTMELVSKQAVCSPKLSEQSIECQDFDETNVDNLTEKINEFSDQDYYKLVLVNIRFVNGTIRKSWLKDVEIQIKMLEIRSCNVKIIEEEAFTDGPFENLESLTLTNLPIDYLQRESFLNTPITTFSLTFDTAHTINVEAKVLEGMRNSLTTLSITNCLESEESLKNLTGINGVHLASLTILDLRSNQLSKITGESFTNCFKLQSLYLSTNILNELAYNSFRLTNLQNLDISSNQLETLPEGIFDSITSGLIQIGNNYWRCDCDLLWFKYFYEKYQNILFRGVEFLCNNQVLYNQVLFCDNDTTISTTTTTSSTIITKTIPTTTTQPPLSNLIWVDCKVSEILADDKLLHFTQRVGVRNNTIEFTFYQIDDEPSYIVEIDGDYQTDYLLWKNSNNRSDIGCFMNLSRSIQINLEYEQTYTLCLLKKGADTVSPFDCTSLTVPPDWASRTWLENSKQPLTISILCLTILLTIFLSSLIMFYCIRQNPYLIRGNKRVIIVGNKTTDAIILPKTYERTNYTAPSLHSYSDGYLTPKIKHYKYHKNNNTYNKCKRPALRTISEQSLESIYPSSSGCGNYGTTRLRRHQMRPRTRFDHVAKVFSEHLYEPPPLPPNHPSEQPNKL